MRWCSGLRPDDSDSTGNCTFLGCSNWNLCKATPLGCWRRCPLLTAQATECSRGVAIGIYARTCRQGWMGSCTFKQAGLATQTAEGSWSVTIGIFAGTLGQPWRRFLQESVPLLTAQTVGRVWPVASSILASTVGVVWLSSCHNKHGGMCLLAYPLSSSS